jgi:hypothetical protein
VLLTGEKAPFFEEVHKASGYPEPVGPGNDKIVDIGILICIMFG